MRGKAHETVRDGPLEITVGGGGGGGAGGGGGG